MRIIPDYFREMAEWTMSLVNRASDGADRSYLDSVARTYCELADEAEQAYLPFEPARVYAPSLYVELADDVSSNSHASPPEPVRIRYHIATSQTTKPAANGSQRLLSRRRLAATFRR